MPRLSTSPNPLLNAPLVEGIERAIAIEMPDRESDHDVTGGRYLWRLPRQRLHGPAGSSQLP